MKIKSAPWHAENCAGEWNIYSKSPGHYGSVIADFWNKEAAANARLCAAAPDLLASLRGLSNIVAAYCERHAFPDGRTEFVLAVGHQVDRARDAIFKATGEA